MRPLLEKRRRRLQMRKTLPPLTGCWVHSFHSYEKYRNVREAAESLGMTPSTFVRKRQKYTKNVD